MSIKINNTTVTSQLTIIFDSAPNLDKKNQPNDGPALGSGNTESDVIIDGTTFLIYDLTLRFRQKFMLFNVEK